LVDTFVSSVRFLCKPLLLAHVFADCQRMALTYDEHRVGTIRCVKTVLIITNHDVCQAKSRMLDLEKGGAASSREGVG
jgi:hypothetical protein